MSRQPVLFISHGAPTFAVEPGRLGPQLQELGRTFAGLRAVLIVSPHWQTPDVRVASTAQPETIHDFGGFPAELYALRYPAPGAPDVAAAAAGQLAAAGFAVSLDAQRGLDHGAWVPMRHLLPDAKVPVFQVSLPRRLDTAGAFALGRALAPLRDAGVLIVGSGSLTHNLYEFRGGHEEAPYAREFARWTAQAVAAGDVEALRDYRRRAPHAQRAHPSEEHYLPLLVAAGAADDGDASSRLDGGIAYGVLSMDSYLWRPRAAADAARAA